MKHYKASLNGNIIELPKPVCKILEMEKHQCCMVCPTFDINGLALLSLPIWAKIETTLSHLDNNKNNDRLKFRTLFFADVAIASGNQIEIHPQLIQLFLRNK